MKILFNNIKCETITQLILKDSLNSCLPWAPWLQAFRNLLPKIATNTENMIRHNTERPMIVALPSLLAAANIRCSLSLRMWLLCPAPKRGDSLVLLMSYEVKKNVFMPMRQGWIEKSTWTHVTVRPASRDDNGNF